MDELTKIFLTAGLTIFGGVVVFVLGQLIGKFFIEPVYELKRSLTDIQFSLIFYAREILTPVTGDEDRCSEASAAIRKHAAELWTKVKFIPFYTVLSKLTFGFLPGKHACRKAASQLIGLSNSVHRPDRSINADRIEKIGGYLGFEDFD